MRDQQWSGQTDLKRAGAILPLFAVMLPVLFVLVAFVVNIAYMQLTDTQLQISTDSAARAAGRMYQITGDQAVALQFANLAGQANEVAGEPLRFEAGDLEFGRSTRPSLNSRYVFTPSNTNQNAVRLKGRRDSSSVNGNVNTFLPTLIGTSSFELTNTAESTQVEVDIAIVFDRSGSMAYADNEVAAFPPAPATAPLLWNFDQPVPPDSRWLDAVSAVKVFLNELMQSPQDELVTLATYASNAMLDVPLTNNYSQILTGLDVHTQGLSVGGTNINAGLNMGVSGLLNGAAREFATKVILLMTDGKKNVGGNPVSAAEDISEDGIMVFTVTFANEADQNLMQNVADKGQGMHFHANTGADLINVFQELGKQLPTLITK